MPTISILSIMRYESRLNLRFSANFNPKMVLLVLWDIVNVRLIGTVLCGD